MKLHYCVMTEKNGTIFGLTTEGTATDIFERMASFQTLAEAKRVADAANNEHAWSGFNWVPDQQELP